MSCINAKIAAVSRESITVELESGERFVLPFERRINALRWLMC